MTLRVTRDSPCIAVCTTLYDDVCRGCRRTAYEVANWVTFTQEQKNAVWERLENEMHAMPRKNQGNR